MGYTIELSNGNEPVKVPRHDAGSIIKISNNGLQGQVEGIMDVTSNYSPLYNLALGFDLADFLYGKKAKDTIDVLKLVVKKLGTKQYRRLVDNAPPLVNQEDFANRENYYIIDYWCPTMGNAGYIAAILLDWANLHPEAVWRVYG